MSIFCNIVSFVVLSFVCIVTTEEKAPWWGGLSESICDVRDDLKVEIRKLMLHFFCWYISSLKTILVHIMLLT